MPYRFKRIVTVRAKPASKVFFMWSRCAGRILVKIPEKGKGLKSIGIYRNRIRSVVRTDFKGLPPDYSAYGNQLLYGQVRFQW